MKLKKVTVNFEFVIVVQDDASENECYDVAYKNAQEAYRDMNNYDCEFDVEDYENNCIQGWDDNCIPYGGDGNTPTGAYK